MVLRKDELEIQLKDEHQLIKEGVLRDDSPLDTSNDFNRLCDACRRGDLKDCHEMIAGGVNINARDIFDYTPLILASLCGHYEVVQLLLESGALCERDTFQGERCLYNALTNRIRNLLLQYDYSKSSDPLQPLASHITSLLTKRVPKTSDITLTSGTEDFHVHKFILSARSPYFRKKLSLAPETTQWKLAPVIPDESFEIALRYLYLGEVPVDLGLGPKSRISEEDVLKGIDKVGKHLEIESLWEGILAGEDRRIARQRHQDEVARGRDQLESWYRDNVLKHKIILDTKKANNVKWDRNNTIFADVILRADVDPETEAPTPSEDERRDALQGNGIPIGPSASEPLALASSSDKSVLFPVHRAILIRSEYFMTMFSSSFQEAQVTPYLQIIPVDCSPEVLEAILNFLYTEKADFSLDIAIDVLLAADMLFIEKLKAKAAVIISTLGNGDRDVLVDETASVRITQTEEETINIYDVIRAGWLTRVQRLEEFAARYLAYRLEDYIDEEEFEELIKESASRIEKRQETDSIELLDDIRYYLSERFRLRFEGTGMEEMMDENRQISEDAGNDAETDGNVVNDDKIPQESMESIYGANIRTLDGEVVGDEFDSDSINYQILLEKIDKLLERLKLDA
ncbi:hypothetical protein VE01_08222 [Pseudogymnoascus verrucosus]|uniref:BTB domain-containing protein n=1 Tax=Pseudogymnoascus verrucosus TaxID=342668 RepID=A0A1B8GDK2_9PEZI|nr:uncharacterized protein VE01_08222 [Pseudogymnoascus verrucosus]OBT93903.1 hypothetical protein VE01_08222 [Pseudogymnoascus verrucosus]